MKQGIVFAIFIIIACVFPPTAVQAQSKDYAQKNFENEDVLIVVSVHSGVYTYEVTNLSQSPITGFEVIGPGAFAIIIPDKWDKEITTEFLRATTTEKNSSIFPQLKNSFQLYAIGKGSVLGMAQVRITFESGRSSLIENVWAPVLEPGYYTWLIITCLLLIIAIHTGLIIGRNKKELIRP